MKIAAPIIMLGIIISVHFNVLSQNDTILQSTMNKQLIVPYVRHNVLFKEQVYVHFNKSCYLPGDDIWFTTYVINPYTGMLNPYTTNLYVELYDQKGKLLNQKILPVNAGTANNVFTLNEKASPGQYTFRAYTTWMKNFYSTDEFDSHIEIAGDEIKGKTISDPQYDVQFFAESGALLEGTFNKIAVKALDPNGISATLSGIIFDSNNDSIVSFRLNQMGMGEFVLNPLKGATYKAKITLPNGKEQIVALPAVENKGVIASVNVFLNNKIGVEIKSNAETVGAGRIFYILIHSNGNVFRTLTTRLMPDQPSSSFSFDRKETGNGVNCLTVFDENFQPVAERLFYNNNSAIRGKVDIKPLVVSDSIQFNLAVADISGKHHYTNLSISVLPEGTISNHFSNSLLSDVLLRSGVRGKIENPMYYFEKEDIDHSVARDLLLLTQGWRKYDWHDFMTNDKRFPNDFEKGFTITGSVKNWLNGKEDKGGRVSIVSPKNKLFKIAKVDSAGHFSIAGLYLADSSTVMVSASSSKGKNWNRTIQASFEPNHQVDTTIKVKPFVNFSTEPEKPVEPPLKLLPGVIQLPEFTVTAQRIVPFEGSVYVSSFDKSVEITKENYSRYTSLENLLTMEFNVRLTIDDQGNYQLDMGRASKTTPPRLIIDDIPVMDMNFLYGYSIDQIEAVSVNRDGNAVIGDGGALIIKTRKKAINWGSATSPNLKYLLVKGFSPHIEYYTPKYLQKPESDTFQKYASIFWKPDIVTDSTGVASFRFNVPKEVNVLNVRTEGISSDGTIYLDERKVVIKRGN